MRVEIPRLPASFVGTGDLFTALTTGWLDRTEGDLKTSLEQTTGTMQVALLTVNSIPILILTILVTAASCPDRL